MTDRERLVEVLKKAPLCNKDFDLQYSDGTIEKIADHILADGWMRPPYKVGQKIYYNNEYTDEKTLESKCESIAINEYGIQVIFYDFYRGKVSLPARYVYATREEAEKALGGG